MAIKTTIKTHCEDCGEPTAKIQGRHIWSSHCHCKHEGYEKSGPVDPPRRFELEFVMVIFNGGDPLDLVRELLSKPLKGARGMVVTGMDGRHISKARDKWMESEHGQRCLEGSILSNPSQAQYLKNRIESAFLAGLNGERERSIRCMRNAMFGGEVTQITDDEIKLAQEINAEVKKLK